MAAQDLEPKDSSVPAPMPAGTGHTQAVRCAAFTRDSDRIVTCSLDGTAKVWDALTGQVLTTLRGNGAGLLHAALSSDSLRLVTCSQDNIALVWDTSTNQPLFTLTGHSDAVTSAAFSPNCRYIVTCGWDGKAIIWDARTGQNLHALADCFQTVAVSPDGKCLISGSSDHAAVVRDATSEEAVLTLPLPRGAVHAGFSRDGARILTCAGDSARVWNAATGEQLLELKQNEIACAAFSPDGRFIATVGGAGRRTANVWDAVDGQALTPLLGH